MKDPVKNRIDWEIAVFASRKRERGESLQPREIEAFLAIDLEVSCAIFPRHADWLRELRDGC